MFIVASGPWQTGSSRPNSTTAEIVRRYPEGIVRCARAASEIGVSRQEGFVRKGGQTLLLIEYHK